MSSKERILDTTMAVIRQRLGMEPPYFKEIRSQDATQRTHAHFMPITQYKWQQSSHQEAYFRWNKVFHPWEKTPFPFHLRIGGPHYLNFPSKRGHKEPEKFSVVLMSYKRKESVRELLAGLNGLDLMDRVC